MSRMTLNIIRLAIILLAISGALAHGADNKAADPIWDYIEEKDSLRGTITKYAFLDAVPTSPAVKAGFRAQLGIVLTGQGEVKATLFLERGQIRCNESCTFLSRIDGGEIKKVESLAGDNWISPLAQRSFASAIAAGKKLIVELHTLRGPAQYVFNVEGLRLTIEPMPKESPVKYVLGAKLGEFSNLKGKRTVEADTTCISGLEASEVASMPAIGKATLCFFKGRLYQVILLVDGAEHDFAKRFRERLAGIYGAPAIAGKVRSWPREDGGLMQNSSTAVEAELEHELMFVLNDDAISMLKN